MSSTQEALQIQGRRRLLEQHPQSFLPDHIPPHPVGQMTGLLEAGIQPAQIWPASDAGFSVLLPCNKVTAPRDGKKPEQWPEAYRFLQEVLERQQTGDPSAPVSAICTHISMADLLAAAGVAICQPGWFHDPSRAVLIAANQEEADQLLGLLRLPDCHGDSGDGRSVPEDPLAAAQWVAEELMPPHSGWRFSGAQPVLLASEIGATDSWREVFLSPGCWELSSQGLLPAVRAARVGLHVICNGKKPQLQPVRSPATTSGTGGEQGSMLPTPLN
ncbi:hypothetical protein [Cyanobium sp. ULC084]